MARRAAQLVGLLGLTGSRLGFGSRLEVGSGPVAGLEAQLDQLVSACLEAQLGSSLTRLGFARLGT